VDGRHDLADSLARARYSSIALEPRRGGLYYSKFTPDQGPRAYHHVMGTDQAEDRLVFGEGLTPDEILGITLSDDGRWALFSVYHGSAGRNDVYLQNVAEHGPVVTVIEGVEATFDVQFAGDRLAIDTNWEAPNGRVFVAELANPGREHWKEVVPASDAVIQQMALAGGKLFLRTLRQVIPGLQVYDLNGKPAGQVRFPSIGTVSGMQGRWDGPELFFNFESYNVPRTIVRYQIAHGRRSEWWRSKAPVRSNDFVVKQVWYPSKDGTRVPMFVMHKKGLKLDGSRPTLLFGYGGFKQDNLPSFKPMALVLAEMGGVYASANLRGGSELGEAWHRAGMLEHKQNTFDDFAAAGEWLIANRYTSSAKLAVQGASNGGLLVGALLTQRPELASVALCSVPLLDMLRYDRFLVARFWVPEYGSAENPEQFRYLHDYSPYHHVKQGERYPATLIVSGDLDTRVAPLHARKMTALLQAATGSGQPVVLLYDTEFGHMGGKPIRLVVEDVTDQMLFMLHGLGVPVESQGARIGSTAASPSQP
jgi:prolyl oligopeptidase